jgi:hypothetical protein
MNFKPWLAAMARSALQIGCGACTVATLDITFAWKDRWRTEHKIAGGRPPPVGKATFVAEYAIHRRVQKKKGLS